MPLDGTLYQPPDDKLDTLLKVRELLSDPKRWTQRTMSRDKNDLSCSDIASANSVCLLGAFMKVVGVEDVEMAFHSSSGPLVWVPPELFAHVGFCSRALSAARDRDSITNVAIFNDTHTYADVLDLLDRAIAARRAVLLEKADAV